MLGAVVAAQRFARRSVQGAYRRVGAQSHIDSLANGHQASGQVARTAAESAEVPLPDSDRPLPQDYPAKGIPRHELPPGRQHHGGDRTLVDNVEQPAASTDCGTDACQVVVASGPQRVADPLELPRQPDLSVGRDRIVRRVMQEVRPLVYLGRARLDEPLRQMRFLVRAEKDRHPAGRQDPQNLLLLHSHRAADYQQIHEVVDIRQAFTLQALDGHTPVEAERLDFPASASDFGCVAVQPVHQAAFAGPQRGSKLAVTTAKVDDQPPAYSAGSEDA